MPRLYVPSIGDQLRLTKDWTFRLHYEYRNSKLLAAIGAKVHGYGSPAYTRPNGEPLFTGYYNEGPDLPHETMTLPAGTVLKVDRIYIKKGSGDFDSMTFYVKKESGAALDKKFYGARFWVKLADANTIEFEEVAE